MLASRPALVRDEDVAERVTLVLTFRVTSPLAVLTSIIPPVPPASTSWLFVGFGDILLKLLLGSDTLHFGAPPRLLPPTPPSLNVHTSLSVTRISLTPRFANPLASRPCAGNWTFRARVRGPHHAVTVPDEEPDQRTSANGSTASAVGKGLGSVWSGGRGRSWRGLYSDIPRMPGVEMGEKRDLGMVSSCQ